MKFILTLICLLSFNLSFGQKKPQQNTNAIVFVLGEKPIGPTDCFRLPDFKKEMNVESLPLGVDSVAFDLYLVRGFRPVATVKFHSLKEFREFDYYNWLSTGQTEMAGTKNNENKTKSATIATAHPGDRLLIEMKLMNDGKTDYKFQNLHFCKP